MERMGFTTTLPVEAILAAGLVPVDLNNAFIAGPDPDADISAAEKAGIPRSICAWIKGIYGTVARTGIRRVVGVLEGDCSYTQGLVDILRHEGIEVTGFRFPHAPSPPAMADAIAEFAAALGVSSADAQEEWHRLLPLRAKLRRLDDLTVMGKVSGTRNFRYLINASDFMGDPAAYEKTVDEVLRSAESAAPAQAALRLAVVGIPPAFTDLFDFLERRGALVVYNEMPVEFAAIRPAQDIFTQYSSYTYPYAASCRLARIADEVGKRRVDGVIHYVQTFCYRGMHDVILRKTVKAPVLTLEGDRPAKTGGREALRLEAFLEMLLDRRGPDT